MNQPPSAMQVELVPGKLTAKIILHDISSMEGPVPCWVYLSDGLRAHGQREIAFALRRLPGEPPDRYPPDPLHFFMTVLSLAERGQLVDTGSFTEFGQRSLFQNPNLRGLGYLRMHPLLGLPAPPDALAMIALFGQEVDVVKAHGLTRVMARLGHASRQFPCPAWSERDRPCLVAPATLEQSILRGVPTLFVSGTTVAMENNQITLLAPMRSIGLVRSQLAQLPPNAPFALLCELDPRADACLVWQPGQRGPEGISPHGSQGARLAGCFALFVTEQDADTAQIFEDGFAVMMRAPTTVAIRGALSSGNPVTIPPSGQGPGFSLAWDANAGPPAIAGPSAAPAGELYMRIHQSLPDLAARLPAGGLNEYADAVERTLHATFASLPRGPGQDLWLGVELTPTGQVNVRLQSRPGLDQGTLKRVYDALMALRPPPVKGGPVSFQGVMAIWGGTGAPLDPG